ncbi:hypothetical protein E2C01_100511 [Portunus trituberculatus]|uniref:Uncharacterized protein n=1 Tax=Portunus trituberculatus TaxID=210409 RepID=A0A5B7K374_PORTR|nr:hypothetical protein [Portunus trituberculatus]
MYSLKRKNSPHPNRRARRRCTQTAAGRRGQVSAVLPPDTARAQPVPRHDHGPSSLATFTLNSELHQLTKRHVKSPTEDEPSRPWRQTHIQHYLATSRGTKAPVSLSPYWDKKGKHSHTFSLRRLPSLAALKTPFLNSMFYSSVSKTLEEDEAQEHIPTQHSPTADWRRGEIAWSSLPQPAARGQSSPQQCARGIPAAPAGLKMRTRPTA